MNITTPKTNTLVNKRNNANKLCWKYSIYR